MFTFLKAQVSSLLSTAVDFLITIILKEFFGVWYLVASVTGTICGGITNFLLGRIWVFSSKQKAAGPQVLKYALVWTGNLLLNAGGMYLFTDMFGIKYWISKVTVSLIVGIGYNYVLQKFFVFKK